MTRPADSTPSTDGRARRIGLVGCVKDKADTPQRAKDLYVSALFTGRRSYVEQSCSEWWILSAEHGLVHPEEVLAPYDVALKEASRAVRRQWSASVLKAMDSQIAPGPDDVVEIHAGAEYRDFGVVDGLRIRGCTVEIPTEGMRIGHQRRFYKQASENRT